MSVEDRPLSTLVSQGWEVVGFSASTNAHDGLCAHSILLRRMKAHKILRIRRKLFGGVTISETDI